MKNDAISSAVKLFTWVFFFIMLLVVLAITISYGVINKRLDVLITKNDEITAQKVVDAVAIEKGKYVIDESYPGEKHFNLNITNFANPYNFGVVHGFVILYYLEPEKDGYIEIYNRTISYYRIERLNGQSKYLIDWTREMEYGPAYNFVYDKNDRISNVFKFTIWSNFQDVSKRPNSEWLGEYKQAEKYLKIAIEKKTNKLVLR